MSPVHKYKKTTHIFVFIYISHTYTYIMYTCVCVEGGKGEQNNKLNSVLTLGKSR